MQQAPDRGRNPKAEAAVERLKEKPHAKRAQESEGEAAPSESERSEPVAGRDRATGRFREGHRKLGGRVAGSKDRFPRNSFKAMTDIIAGRVMKHQKDKESGQKVAKSAAEIMAKAIFEGMAGELVLHQDSKGGITYANPLLAVKLYLDYMLRARELAIRVAALKKKEKGSGGGIRIVLPSVPADPLLKPGQKPRPLRLLGQDPSKPLPDAARTATDARPSAPGSVSTHADGARKSANTRSTPTAITSPHQRLNQPPSAEWRATSTSVPP